MHSFSCRLQTKLNGFTLALSSEMKSRGEIFEIKSAVLCPNCDFYHKYSIYATQSFFLPFELDIHRRDVYLNESDGKCLSCIILKIFVKCHMPKGGGEEFPNPNCEPLYLGHFVVVQSYFGLPNKLKLYLLNVCVKSPSSRLNQQDLVGVCITVSTDHSANVHGHLYSSEYGSICLRQLFTSI